MQAQAPTLTTEALWHALHRDLSAFIRSRVGDAHLADDLLQETFVRIHRGLDGLHDQTRVTGWAYRIARNVVIDHARTKTREQPVGENHEPIPQRLRAGPTAAAEPGYASGHSIGEGPGPEGEAQTAGLASPEVLLLGRWLMSMIPRLPEPYREAVRLAELEGVSQAEIAARLGLSPSGARSRVQRGRAQLRALLKGCCDVALDRRGNVLELTCRSCGCEQNRD